MTAQREIAINLSGIDEPVRVSGASAAADYFAVYSAEPALGRSFTPEDEEPGAPPVVVLGHRLWLQRFSGDASILGRTIRLDEVPTTVVGILPPNDYSPDLVVPLRIDPASTNYRERALFVAARRKPGVTLEQARAAMAAIGDDLERTEPNQYRGWSINTQPLQEEFVGPQARRVFSLLGAAAAIILLIACVNVANVMLVRGVARDREFAVRTALGASRGRLIRQLLAESTLVGAGGGALGLLLSVAGLRGLRAAFEAGAPYMERAVVDQRAMACALVATLVSCAAFALMPAWHATRAIPAAALRQGAYGSEGRRSQRLRSLLVGGEVTLAVLLVLLAVLFGRGLVALQRIAAGFEADHVLTMRVALSVRQDSSANIAAFYDSVLDRLRALPAVIEAGATTRVPAAGSRFNPNRSIVIEGQVPAGGDTWFADDLTISPGYLEALRIPLRQGRRFSASDGAAASPLVALVSETMAVRYWPNSSPLGSRMRLGDEPVGEWRTIVGVVGDVRNDDIDAPPLPHVYVPLAQRPSREMTLVVRSVDDPLLHVAQARAAVAAVDRNQPLYDIQTMTQIVAEDLRGTVVLVALAGLFAIIALALASTGIYGVIAHVVAQARREIGIRIALGAGRGAVVRQVTSRSLKPVVAGAALGVLIGAALARVVAGLLYGVSPGDPQNYLWTLAVLVAAALLASAVPAVRAARTDPIIALRSE